MKMDWLRWIRKYSAGILDTKTRSMETLIDSESGSKSANYAYTSSSEVSDGGGEPVYSAATHARRQRPMLPTPPLASQDSPSTSSQQQSNDVYDCCVSLDGIPIKHEFQYTLSDTSGRGKITKHDIEGLASKILESAYGTTAKFSSRGRRAVKVTLSVRQSMPMPLPPPSPPPQNGRDRSSAKYSQTADGELQQQLYYSYDDGDGDEDGSSVYGDVVVRSSTNRPRRHHHHRAKSYRREQLIAMVQKSLAENLSFQNQRKSNKPDSHYRHRSRRHKSSASKGAQTQHLSTPLSSPPKYKSEPKVAWSPYDFEPAGYIPLYHHRHERLIRKQQQQLYGNSLGLTVVDEQHVQAKLSSGRPQHHSNQKLSSTLQEQTKNIDRHRYKRYKSILAKIASNNIKRHIHEHHHYHHYSELI